MKSLFNAFAVIVLLALCVPQTVNGRKAAYLMAYFKEHGHNVYFAVSRDGRTFTDVNDGNPVMTGDTLAEQKGIPLTSLRPNTVPSFKSRRRNCAGSKDNGSLNYDTQKLD